VLFRSIVWDHDEKAGAFITPQDSALKNYTAFVSESTRKDTYGGYCQPIQSAIQIYSGLRELGMNYQVDAASPFAKVQGKSEVVDSVTLPRLTLKRRYGDCDDLTVLFCSLLESKNVETGYITLPGHIFPAFNTGVPAASYKDVNPDRTMTLVVNDTLWIPVEVTMLDGNNGFMEAWTQAIELWKANEKERAFYRTREVQKLYGPVSLQETDLGLQYGSVEAISRFFSRDRDRLSEAVIKVYAADAAASKGKREYNKLGMIYAQFERYRDAEDAFGRALKIDPKYTGAMVNLGNVAYLRGEYKKAVDTYKGAIAALGKVAPGSPSSKASLIALVNLSKTYKAMGQTQAAKDTLAQAAQIDPEKAREYAYVAAADQASARAANVSDSADLLFCEDEE
jgi:tetratricopeptide (TPR) repeat protein